MSDSAEAPIKKAMVLAAGLGTRLDPVTQTLPKPLVPVAGKPVLERILESLVQAGFDYIIVNAHHLSSQIKAFLSSRFFEAQVVLVEEQDILGTGGGIQNARHFLENGPFLVTNADIVTDMDFQAVYDFHLSHPDPATLVVHDYPQFNQVLMEGDWISGFHEKAKSPEQELVAFTGVQVLDQDIFSFLPQKGFSSSIDAYKAMLSQGRRIRAMKINNLWWRDMGSFEGLSLAAMEAGGRKVSGETDLSIQPIAGDGSDRRWFRISSPHDSLIVADHGPRFQSGGKEADAYWHIGRHLGQKGVPVPRLRYYDAFSGLVFGEDLGDTNLMCYIKGLPNSAKETIYYDLIQSLAHMSVQASEDFNTTWTHQTPRFDAPLIVERECKYFVEQFAIRHAGIKMHFQDLLPEFEEIANQAVSGRESFFVHRDMQSRNIMVKGKDFFFIDFQGGRLGPAQYDAASLIIDPYAGLPVDLQSKLVRAHFDALTGHLDMDWPDYLRQYELLAFSRNLQMLGAFAKLSRLGKPGFAQYIAPAVSMLKTRENILRAFPKVRTLIRAL